MKRGESEMMKVKIGKSCAMVSLFSLFILLFSFAIGSCENPLIQQIVEPKTAAFESNGGSRVASQTVYKGQQIKRPSDPSRSGFTFEAWYCDNGTFLEEWDFSVIPTGDITLYAKWNPEVIIPITDVAIMVTHPVTGVVPSATASGEGNFTIGAVSWLPNDNPFEGEIKYTASVTLTARQGYAFAPELETKTINGNDAEIITNTERALTLSYTFPPTKTVTGIAIATQPKLSYTHGDTLDLSEILVTFTYNDASAENFSLDDFPSQGITASPAHGTMLSRSMNESPVTVKYGNLTPITAGNLTVSPKNTTLTIDPIPVQGYTGSAITPTVTVKDDAATLTLTADYTVLYDNNINVGEATVTITGAGNYLGSTGTATFIISAHATTFTIETIPAVTYNGSAHEPTVTVKAGAVTLALTTDYTVSYTNNTNAGTAGVTITGAGNYAGSAGSATFTINPKVITFTVDTIAAQTYNRSAHEPTVTVRDDTTELSTANYTVSYTNNTNAGTANVGITGRGNYAGSSASATFIINPKEMEFTVVDISAQTYTGSPIQPTVIVMDGTIILTLDTHYTRIYGNNTNVGTAATVTISGKGNYAGSTGNASFTINKATPAAITWPTSNAITYPATLSTSTLTGGSTTGAFAWQTPETIPTVANSGYNVVFTPTDTANYDWTGVTLTQNVAITVNPAIITSAVLSITAPTNGGTPDTTVSIPGGSQFTATVSWSPSPTTFTTEVQYTVTITLTANTNYTFTGGLTTAATINGYNANVSNTGASVTLSHTFDAIPDADGTAEYPFLVNDEDDLRKVGKGTANPAGYTEWTLSAHYKQTAVIDLTGKSNWTAIASGQNEYFTGSYNGSGYTITGLSIDASYQYQGMFGYISTSGKVENLGLINVNINSFNHYVGGIAGYNGGTIQNCYVSGSVKGRIGVGGIAGDNNGTIQNCYATGSVTSTISSSVGGIAGGHNGTVTVRNCVALNQSVANTDTETTVRIGRITGSSGTQQNNYAWSGMTLVNAGDIVLPSEIALASKDGQSITAAEAKTEATWTTAGKWSTNGIGAWDFTNVWQWNGDDGMPSLRVSEGNSTVPPWPGYLAIGDTGPGGGIIFYYDPAGFTVQMADPAQNYTAHYLEAAPADMGAELRWAATFYTGTKITGTAEGIGTGRKNTALILDTLDTNAPAAKACADYGNGSAFNDWFLPSKDELNQFYVNRNTVGNMGTNPYWSSSEYNNNNDLVWVIFSNGEWDYNSKDNSYAVRAIRAF
jgi:uncharacterized repeat protein (TIGR02543 family)